MAATSYVRPRPAHKAQRGIAVPAVQAFIHRRAWWRRVVERSTSAVLYRGRASDTDDLPSVYQLVSYSSRRIRLITNARTSVAALSRSSERLT